MHTANSRISDEIAYFGEPDIELTAPRAWCSECRKQTIHVYRASYRECAEHGDEATEALEM